MSTIDTRHAEKNTLFMLLMAKFTGDIDTYITHAESIMEKEDAEAVRQKFEEWKAQKAAQADESLKHPEGF